MTLRVRDARPEDAEKLHALLHAAYEDRARRASEHVGALASSGGDDRPLTDTLERVRADVAEGLVLVAEDEEGRLVASVMLRRVANIRRLAVAPERKGEGLGGKMLEEAVARAAREGMTYAMLDTIPTHPWLPAFYRRHGFEDRCVERFPDGKDWLQLRRRLD